MERSEVKNKFELKPSPRDGHPSKWRHICKCAITLSAACHNMPIYLICAKLQSETRQKLIEELWRVQFELLSDFENGGRERETLAT